MREIGRTIVGEGVMLNVCGAANDNASVFTITAAELQEAGRWAAAWGPGWCAAPILSDQPGQIGLEIAQDDQWGESVLQWGMERTARGVAVWSSDPWDYNLGTYATVRDALAFLSGLLTEAKWANS